MLIVDIGGDADDAHRRRAHADELDHRIGPRDVPIDGSWSGNMRCATLWLTMTTGSLPLRSRVVEIAAGDQRHAQRGEESRRDDAKLRRADRPRACRAYGPRP